MAFYIEKGEIPRAGFNCKNAKAIIVDLQLWMHGSITKTQTWYILYIVYVNFMLYMQGETLIIFLENIDNCHFGNINVGIVKWSMKNEIAF